LIAPPSVDGRLSVALVVIPAEDIRRTVLAPGAGSPRWLVSLVVDAFKWSKGDDG
jgi:hypothetical protein